MNHRFKSRGPEIHIQMKPLILASDNDGVRQNEIDYIEGSSFQQRGFSSSRSCPKLIAPSSSHTASSCAGPISGSKSEYSALLNERAHESAIFGQLSGPPTSTLGSDPTDSKENLVSSVDTVKQLIHQRLEKSDETAWASWVLRLTVLKEARAKELAVAAHKRRPTGAPSFG
ncbi:unnamed protein product [Dicrocoelium dendriticum]|nr:unnamed protein product [Dicrocoelium dendriticum]